MLKVIPPNPGKISLPQMATYKDSLRTRSSWIVHQELGALSLSVTKFNITV